MTTRVDRLYDAMLAYFAGDPRRCQHLLKVHSLAARLGRAEGLDPASQETLELAALCHDCGIKPAEAQLGYNNGKLQEAYGPGAARQLLAPLGLGEGQLERICYLVGHHHSYEQIQGLDFQLLVESDLLVNFYEDGLSQDRLRPVVAKLFRSASGRALAEAMYGLGGEKACSEAVNRLRS